MFAGSLSMLEFTVRRVCWPIDRTSLPVEEGCANVVPRFVWMLVLKDFSSRPQPREISGSFCFSAPKTAPDVLFLGL